MKLLETGVDLDRFFRKVSTASRRALLLDYDGTLAPFHRDPAEALPYQGVPELLDHIMLSGNTRLIVISGRWTRDLMPLLGLRTRPEIWGSHGWERLAADGRLEIAEPEARALGGLAEADTWDEEIVALGGRVEQKPAGLAVHWRGLPHDAQERVRRLIVEKWAWLAQESSLELHEFEGGLELRVPGRNKGFAVNTVLSELGPDPAVAYLGDDLTDEDAFRAIKGKGLGVLVRPEGRPTAADVWLQPPEELLDFLRRWSNASEKSQ